MVFPWIRVKILFEKLLKNDKYKMNENCVNLMLELKML